MKGFCIGTSVANDKAGDDRLKVDDIFL